MTVYDEMMKNMTEEGLARILVKPCVLNMEEMYYVTTTGQLYPFNGEGFTGAVKLQLQYLNTGTPDQTPDPNTRRGETTRNPETEDSAQLSFDDIPVEDE